METFRGTLLKGLQEAFWISERDHSTGQLDKSRVKSKLDCCNKNDDDDVQPLLP